MSRCEICDFIHDSTLRSAFSEGLSHRVHYNTVRVRGDKRWICDECHAYTKSALKGFDHSEEKDDISPLFKANI